MRNARDSLASARLATLAELKLDDARAEADLDAIVALASMLAGCSAVLNMVGERTVWAKAHVGAKVLIAPRTTSFCDVVVRSGEPLVVPDTLADPRFADNVHVTGAQGVRYYAGFPISAQTAAGFVPIGALAMIDGAPHAIDPVQLDALERLATVTNALIAARLSAKVAQTAAHEAEAATQRYRRQDRLSRNAERMAAMGYWTYRLADERIEWSDGVYRIHGLAPGAMPDLNRALDFYPPHARGLMSDALARAIECGAAFDIETDFITAKGEHRRVRSMGEVEMEKGRTVALIGTFQDVTERYRMEQSLRDIANHDEVTRIANRASFNRALEAAMIRAGTYNTPLMLALIDLDDFKAVNDTFGHLAGDDVLRATGARLREPWLAGSFAARLGGDEFALIVEDPHLIADPEDVARRLSARLAAPALTSAGEVPMSGTVGTAVLSDEVAAMRDLMHAADTMLYRRKRSRRAGAARRVANG